MPTSYPHSVRRQISHRLRSGDVEGLITRGHYSRSACRIMGLSRSTFHAHRRRPVSNRRVRRIIVADTIEKIHQRSRGTYGKRRIRAELLDTYEMNVNHKLMSAIMTELGIAGLPRPGKRKPNLLGVETLSDRVNRGFTASRPNELWVTDITEHPTPWIPAIVATPTGRCCNGWQKVHGSAEGRILPITR